MAPAVGQPVQAVPYYPEPVQAVPFDPTAKV
jgi:hypothetical protein